MPIPDDPIRRTIWLMRVLSRYRGQWFGVTQVANDCGLPGNTVHRYFQIFVEYRILEQSKEENHYRKYRVPPRKERRDEQTTDQRASH